MPIHHVLLNTLDIVTVSEFYDKALAPLGFTKAHNYDNGAFLGYADASGPSLWLKAVKEAQQVTTNAHIAFECQTHEQVKAAYEAALAAGGKDNGGPGYRTYRPNYYATFFYDPEGRNIEVLCLAVTPKEEA